MEQGELEESTSSGIGDQIKNTYRWWDNLASWHPEDPWLVVAAKFGVRVMGIVVLIALSPLILLGFLMAFIVVA